MDNRSSLFADLFAPENADVATVFRAGLEGALLSPAAGSLSSSAVKPSVSNGAREVFPMRAFRTLQF